MSELRLTKARTLVFDPSKKYIIQVKREALPMEDISKINEWLREQKVEAIVVMLPKNQHMKVIEAK